MIKEMAPFLMHFDIGIRVRAYMTVRMICSNLCPSVCLNMNLFVLICLSFVPLSLSLYLFKFHERMIFGSIAVIAIG